jgi:hypothetical protein
MPDVQTPSGTDPNTSGNAPAGGQEALSHLYHMSTTAGVGSQDYVAINPTSIAALLLGLGSVVVVLGYILLLVPAVGIVCAIVALIQISRSNQTQTGRGLAISGLVLCVLFAGGRLGFAGYQRLHTASDERQVAQLMHELGDDLEARRYDQAYALFDDRFRARVDMAEFTQEFDNFIKVGIGRVLSIEWNRQGMEFEQTPDSGTTYGTAMGLFRFASGGEPTRLVIQFDKISGQWKITSIPNLFPAKKNSRPS